MALPIPTKDALTGETVMLKLRRFWRYFVDWVQSANPIIESVEGVGTQLTAIESRVDSQDARITQNTSDITQNANAIAVNSEQIQENILDITENADNIQSIEDELTVITPKVNKAVTDITNLDGEIADTNAHLNTIEGELDSHVANRNNPHGVTKEQLGLTAVMQPYGSVETYADLPADAPAGATYNVRQAYGDYPPNTNFTKTVSGEWDSMGGEVDFQPVYDSINDVATDLSAHITQSNARFTNIETKNSQQDTAIANLDANKQKKLTFGTGLDYNETTGELDINAFVGEVDSTLSTTSENPVQNKIITQALNGKQPTGDYATATQLENLGSTVSDQGTQLSGLATTVQGLQTTIAGVDTKANENANDITALQNSKQNKLTFDTTPTSGSNNPVTSNGIYTALQNVGGEEWELFTGDWYNNLFSWDEDENTVTFLRTFRVSASRSGLIDYDYIFAGTKIRETNSSTAFRVVFAKLFPTARYIMKFNDTNGNTTTIEIESFSLSDGDTGTSNYTRIMAKTGDIIDYSAYSQSIAIEVLN